MFCALDESLNHLFFNCSVARYIWSVFQCSVNSLAQQTSVAELPEWVLKFKDLKEFQSKYVWLLCSGLLALVENQEKACFELTMSIDPCGIIYHIFH
jgi:hypothetical protein